MKKLYSALIAMIAFIVFAAPALADPGNTWDQIVTRNRFRVLSGFNDEAVLDKETGRVWEQSPSADSFNWFQALARCYQLEVGGRKGWRLPTIEELASLVDRSQPAPTLPTGHPFDNVQSFTYWSTTTLADSAGKAWVVSFADGGVGNGVNGKADDDFFVWCVRGGQGIDGVQ